MNWNAGDIYLCYQCRTVQRLNCKHLLKIEHIFFIIIFTNSFLNSLVIQILRSRWYFCCFIDSDNHNIHALEVIFTQSTRTNAICIRYITFLNGHFVETEHLKMPTFNIGIIFKNEIYFLKINWIKISKKLKKVSNMSKQFQSFECIHFKGKMTISMSQLVTLSVSKKISWKTQIRENNFKFLN